MTGFGSAEIEVEVTCVGRSSSPAGLGDEGGVSSSSVVSPAFSSSGKDRGEMFPAGVIGSTSDL